MTESVNALTSARPRLPGDEGLWFFIAADMGLFLLLFGSFSSEQADARAMFDSDRHLLLSHLALLNTMFLLTGSWFAACAVESIRHAQPVRVRNYLAGTILLGLAFIVAKIFEYRIDMRTGITLAQDSFCTFYFVITGLHLLHVIGGVVFLCFIWHRLKSGTLEASSVMLLESGATFWHLVDILWLVIFPLLYLLR